jgi:ribonuclease HII
VIVAGVDEAGRGCVIGPLVVAGVSIKEENLCLLVNAGVKDSKQLSPHRREKLSSLIKTVADGWFTTCLSPIEIDQAVECGRRLHKLNRLEAIAFARVIDALKPDIAYVDAADVLEERFRVHVRETLHCKATVVSKHKADVDFPVVSAASIIAKVERDRVVQQLAETYGDFGSGYAGDKRTLRFLEQWLQTNCEYPDFVRKSWKTARNMKKKAFVRQERLF